MTLPADTLLTPRQFVAETATSADAIDLGELTLLGVMQTADGAAALLRRPGGRIARIVVGDNVGAWRIGAIDDARVILLRNGEATALRLPDAPDTAATSLRPQSRPATA